MIDIQLINFFKTGCFGPIEIGMTRQTILNIVGKPDDFGCPTTHYMKAGIWKYGDIEFHFDESESDPTLFLIWCDYIPFPGEKSDVIDFDPWIFSDGHKPDKTEITDRFDKINMKYSYIELESKTADEYNTLSDELQFIEHRCEVILESDVRIGIEEIHKCYKDGREPEIVENYVSYISLMVLKDNRTNVEKQCMEAVNSLNKILSKDDFSDCLDCVLDQDNSLAEIEAAIDWVLEEDKKINLEIFKEFEKAYILMKVSSGVRLQYLKKQIIET